MSRARGVVSGRHQLMRRPAEIHKPSEKRLGHLRGELARERLEYGVRLRTPGDAPLSTPKARDRL
jgi:hypothetical protein